MARLILRQQAWLRRDVAEQTAVCYHSPANIEVVRGSSLLSGGDMAITRILLLGTLLTLIGTAFPALATAKHHHRATDVRPAIYNRAPAAAGGGCTASGGPACSGACTGPGPCAPPDSW
jgi:hypothetical protein